MLLKPFKWVLLILNSFTLYRVFVTKYNCCMNVVECCMNVVECCMNVVRRYITKPEIVSFVFPLKSQCFPRLRLAKH